MHRLATRASSALLGVAAFLFSVAAVAADVTYAYPTAEAPSFYLVAPDSWTATPQGDEDGDEDYFYLESKSGTVLAFRTVPGADYESAMTAHIEYLQEHYTDLVMSDVQQFKSNGLDYVLMPAVGVNEDGSRRQIGSAWFFLPKGEIGEVWYDVEVGKTREETAAKAILGSLSN